MFKELLHVIYGYFKDGLLMVDQLSAAKHQREIVAAIKSYDPDRIKDNEQAQVVFNKVIESGRYKSAFDHAVGSPFMCLALQYAYKDQIISSSEYCLARRCVTSYLGGLDDSTSLACKLRQNNLAYSFDARLHIYKNWAQRPQFKESV
jgi:hypothetical protein